MHFLDIIKGHCKKVCNKNYQPIINSLELIVIKVNSCYNVVVAGTQVGRLWPALNAEVMAGRVWGICFYFYGDISHIWVNPCIRLVTLGFLTKASRVRPTFTTIHVICLLPPFCASVITRVFTQKRLSALGSYILPYILKYCILSFLSSIQEFYFLQMLEVDFIDRSDQSNFSSLLIGICVLVTWKGIDKKYNLKWNRWVHLILFTMLCSLITIKIKFEGLKVLCYITKRFKLWFLNWTNNQNEEKLEKAECITI